MKQLYKLKSIDCIIFTYICDFFSFDLLYLLLSHIVNFQKKTEKIDQKLFQNTKFFRIPI